MVTDRTELDDQLHGEFADAGAISREADVHADVRRDTCASCCRGPPLRVHADPQVPPRHGSGETTMPVLSDRSDVIVITDEAHRTQYDTLALNMRRALPNAVVHGLHRHAADRRRGADHAEQFGDYVSIYNFRDAIEDGATVPLYYENRIPELQLVNEDFADELTTLLEEAELDEEAEGQLARRFGQRVHADHPPGAAADGRPGPRRALRRARASPARRCTSASTRPPRCGCTTSSARRGPSTSPSCAPSTTRCPSWSGRGWPAGSS